MFSELMTVHQGSVDNYLNGIFKSSIEKASVTQAYKEAKHKVKVLNKVIDRAEDRHNKPRHIVKDLMTSFLIPDVQRKKVQRQLQLEQKRFIESARKAMQASVVGAGQKLETEKVLKFEDLAKKE